MLAGVRTAVVLVVLQLTVTDLVHTLTQQAGFIFLQQRVPFTAPDNLEYVPAGTAKHALKFLDDFAIAAYRSIQALQVAVDHEDQVVELFPRR